MSETKLTLADFFLSTKEDLARAAQATAAQVKLSPGKELESLNAGILHKAVEDQIAVVLDISLVGIMLRAWQKYKLVEKYVGKEAVKTSDLVVIPLLQHKIESAHHPYIQVSRAKVPWFKVKFEISLEILVEGLSLHVRSGRIQKIATGSFTASGELKCEDVTLSEKKSKSLNIPGGFNIGPKEEADAQAIPQRETAREG